MSLKNKPIPVYTNDHQAGFITAQPEPGWLVRLLVMIRRAHHFREICRMKKPLLILITTILLTALVGPVNSSPFVSPFCSPISAPPALTFWTAGHNYLFESRAIIALIWDDGHVGGYWFIGNAGTPVETVDQFCRLIHWADPTTGCCQGPAPAGAQIVRAWQYRLPVILKTGRSR